jgi:hypothetical protein
MQSKNVFRLSTFLILTSIFIVSCSTEQQNSANQEPLDGESVPEILETVPAATLPTHSPTPEPTSIPSTPTPDLRTPPDQWQNWPIVPEITNRVYEIYAQGKEMGVNRNAFSKIGDCQNVSDAFLGIYDKPGRYFLRPDETSWQETIDNFSGYFDRDGLSFGQGLNVAAALSPFQADQNMCSPTEGPLQCELRNVMPSFAFISFERWWNEDTPPEVYEQYLRTIIETVIDNGTVPILVTKADNIEGGHRINQIIANLAFEYDIPLYNWWRAARFLPNNGMDPERNDGFHISYEAWDSRSYYALEILNNLWKGLR